MAERMTTRQAKRKFLLEQLEKVKEQRKRQERSKKRISILGIFTLTL